VTIIIVSSKTKPLKFSAISLPPTGAGRAGNSILPRAHRIFFYKVRVM
jgi:hypothetical protein